MPQILGPPAAGDPSPKKLGRYECAEQIGGDSGFETYRARVKGLAGLDRSFALKVLRLKRSEVPAAVSEPFLQAARRSATVADPRVAKVVEADSGEGVVFAVTPFMDGVDLAQFLERAREAGVLATGKGEAARRWHRLVAYLGAEVARGLQAAHAQDPPFLHGALCPGNVFITSRGAIRLLDFGLRASVRRPFEPRPRRLLPYIAPELAAPAADCTRAGDVYSLGVLLFELCNGDLPPQGRRAADTQIALSLLPEDLGLLIGRLLSMSPAARPAAADVVSSLAAVHADTSEAALVADLGSLIQGSSTAAPAESAEASLADAPEGVDDAPPPPSEVEHDDAYGLEGPLQPRTGEPVQAKPAGQPAVRSVQSFFSSPVPSPGEEPSAMQDAGEAMPPSVPAFDAPPATWGARALAALGGQAGIASPFGDPASGLGLFDEIEAEPAQPDLPGPPPVGPAGGEPAAVRPG
jgi:serine/threonine protein kinase